MGNMIRANAKWVEEGEKPTNYFLNLENRHFTNKIIPKLIGNGNEEVEISDRTEILTELELFTKLYTQKVHVPIMQVMTTMTMKILKQILM